MRRSSPPPLEERLRNVSHHLCITSKLSCLARQPGDGATVAKPEAAALDGILTICEHDKPFKFFDNFQFAASMGTEPGISSPKRDVFLILTEHFLWLNLTKTIITALSQHKVHTKQKATYSFNMSLVCRHFICQNLLWRLGWLFCHKP